MPEREYRTSDFDFHLPEAQIAQQPASRRDESRLLVLRRDTGEIEHRVFRDIVELVAPGDVMVVNETRVFPARLVGRRPGGGAAEILLLHPTGEGDWTALVRLHTPLPVDEALERHGRVPLPPYVKREPGELDRERYQTVYARERGSVAAPTAGLHFTPELLQAIEARGTALARLVLHVGVGTFRPVESEDPSRHAMHSEWFSVSQGAADTINRRRAVGGAVWAIGTTSVRTLETVATPEGIVQPGTGWTDIFIRPPYRYRAVDRLVTNFHLPRSTLLMLVAALAGYEHTMRAYREAVETGYRFFSYGDAMAIL